MKFRDALLICACLLLTFVASVMWWWEASNP